MNTLLGAAPIYAGFYQITYVQQGLDVARNLHFYTKSMLALPRRTYNLKGAGWQQEHCRIGPDVTVSELAAHGYPGLQLTICILNSAVY